jgi:hypothetical protein
VRRYDPNLLIARVGVISDFELELSIKGGAGNLVIESSADLLNWSEHDRIAAKANLKVRVPVNERQRHYRVRMVSEP